ncbi:receptor accessory protein 4 [Haplosporangium sp. Z 27]|nr:receptor accessory protein 4 [Haplosporangium sp. Z 27]
MKHITYPAYASYKAINSRNNTRLTAWLMYWTVMGLFTLVEFVLDTFIFWFPFYYEIKLAFVLWMILPQTQGSIYLYQAFVDPYLSQHEHDIDQALIDIQKQAMHMGMQYVKQALQFLQNLALDLYKKSINQNGASSLAEDNTTASSNQSGSINSGDTIPRDTVDPNATHSSARAYFSWAYHALSPKLAAAATMATEAASRQMSAVGRPLPVPSVNLYAARRSSTDSTSSKEPSIYGHSEKKIEVTTTAANSISPSEKAELERLSSRLSKAADSTSSNFQPGSGSLRNRKISLYEDENGEDSPFATTNS